MISIEQTAQKLQIKGDTTFFGLGGIAAIMTGFGVFGMVGVFPFFEEHSAADVFGFVFLCVWTAFALGIAIHAFRLRGKEVTIDDTGVTCKKLFKKSFYSWSDIQDWGLSYCGKAGRVFPRNMYVLYFSKTVFPIKNECRKKLKRKKISCYVIGDDYYKSVRQIIPFCSDRTGVQPFIGKDKLHFW